MNHAHRLGQWAYKNDMNHNPYKQKEEPQRTHWQCGYNHAQQYAEQGYIQIPHSPQKEKVEASATALPTGNPRKQEKTQMNHTKTPWTPTPWTHQSGNTYIHTPTGPLLALYNGTTQQADTDAQLITLAPQMAQTILQYFNNETPQQTIETLNNLWNLNNQLQQLQQPPQHQRQNADNNKISGVLG